MREDMLRRGVPFSARGPRSYYLQLLGLQIAVGNGACLVLARRAVSARSNVDLFRTLPLPVEPVSFRNSDLVTIEIIALRLLTGNVPCSRV